MPSTKMRIVNWPHLAQPLCTQWVF
jgi:hypothetical protein